MDDRELASLRRVGLGGLARGVDASRPEAGAPGNAGGSGTFCGALELGALGFEDSAQPTPALWRCAGAAGVSNPDERRSTLPASGQKPRVVALGRGSQVESPKPG